MLGINYVFDTGHSAYSTLGELSVYMKLIYEKEFMVVGASFPYTNVNADKVFNIYSRMDMITYGSTYSPEVQARMFVDFTIDVLKAGGLGVIAEGGDFWGASCGLPVIHGIRDRTGTIVPFGIRIIDFMSVSIG